MSSLSVKLYLSLHHFITRYHSNYSTVKAPHIRQTFYPISCRRMFFGSLQVPVLLLFCLYGFLAVAADGGDDFSNNLFSDLGSAPSLKIAEFKVAVAHS